MRDAMATRGPDGAGEWFSDDGSIGLAHRRLAIIDLDARAAQPKKWSRKSEHGRKWKGCSNGRGQSPA